MYQVYHKKIGYVVIECETIEQARVEKKHYGRSFAICDSNGNDVK